MDKIDIDKLRKIHQSKLNLKYKAFDQIIKMCHTKINTIGVNGTNYCLFAIPRLIWGYSIYDMNECREYVMDKLKEEGFTVNYYDPNILFIEW